MARYAFVMIALIVLAFGLTLTSSASATQRCVLVDFFSSTA